MANCNAIKIRPRKNPIPTPANLAHNCAMKKANYWLNDGAEIIQSKVYTDYRKLNEDFKNWEKEAEKRYSTATRIWLLAIIAILLVMLIVKI